MTALIVIVAVWLVGIALGVVRIARQRRESLSLRSLGRWLREWWKEIE